HELDVTDAAAVEAFAARVFDEDGGVDILHNNAGIGHAGEIEHTTVDDWRRVIDVNLLGVAYGDAAFVPRMLRQGRGAHLGKLIQPVPAKHVSPGWLLHRISPRIQQSQARKLADMLSGN